MNKVNYDLRCILCKLYTEQLSIEQIATRTKLSMTTVKKYLSQANLFHPTKRNKLSTTQKLQALVFIKQGDSIRSISNQLGVKYHLIYQIKQNHAKASINRFKRLNKEQKQEIELEYQNGKSCSSIAKKLNVATSTITRYLKQHKKRAAKP